MDPARTDVVFFGSGAFGLPTLERLVRTRNVSAIVTQPDRPAGRGSKLTPTPVGAWAAEHLPDIPILKPERVAEPDVVDRVRALPAVAWVVIAYGQKLPPPLLADRFAINLHASLLPRWRGAAPINWAILAGDHQTGNSVITLADRMDAGLVLGQSRRTIEPHLTTGELHDLLAEDGPALVEQVLDEHAAGTIRPIEQDEARVTHARKLSKADAWIDLRDSPDACRRRVHGLNPWPGVLVRLDDEPLKLRRVEAGPPNPERKGEPGRVLDWDSGLVACGSGSLRLLIVQPEGRRAMAWSEFARGRRAPDNATLAGREGETC